MSDPVTRLNAALSGRYAIERELGEGGMATVYLADDLKHERKVALKVLKPELAAVVGAERFLAEIKTTANLTHPHILPLHDSGEADSFLFYVMPHIEGESLRERIDREKQLGVDDAVGITQKVANALDYAHENGVVHRDIKPGNILLSAQGEPLVADFGIALAVAQAGAGRITETGLSLGTPHYMSPEQATGDRDVDPRSDVYALGCVLYEMLAGQPPFLAATAQAVLVKILTADAPSITSERRTVPPHVGHALARALEKLPADRFTSAAEFAAALGDPSFTYEARARTSSVLDPGAGSHAGARHDAWPLEAADDSVRGPRCRHHAWLRLVAPPPRTTSAGLAPGSEHGRLGRSGGTTRTLRGDCSRWIEHGSSSRIVRKRLTADAQDARLDRDHADPWNRRGSGRRVLTRRRVDRVFGGRRPLQTAARGGLSREDCRGRADHQRRRRSGLARRRYHPL